MKLKLIPTKNDIGYKFPQILAILVASLGSISSAMLFSWTSPAIPQLIDDPSMDISLEEASYFTVISPISMIIASPLFSYLIHRFGTKKAVISIAIPQLIGWILIGFAKNIWVFYLARFVSGIGDAGLYGTVPIYVGEISEPTVRGTWGNSVSIGIYLGMFLINVIGAYNSIPISALICGSIALIYLLLVIFVPESPYYLLANNKEAEAEETLKVLRWKRDVNEELKSLKADVKRQISESGTMKDLFTIDSNRKALFICMGLRIAQQFSGLPAFELHTQYMFQQSGSDISEKMSAMVFSGCLTLGVGLSAFVVERLGRRPLMLFSCFGCTIILIIQSMYFTLVQFTDFDLSLFNWVPLAGMVVYIFVNAAGLGILPNLMLGEIFSASVKGKASFLTNAVYALCLLIVPNLFQGLTHNFGLFASFYLFAGSCFLGGVFSYMYVVETKGKTLEEIQQALKGVDTRETANTINVI